MTIIESPLNDEHVALGATLVPFAGWSMPLRYSSDLAEHQAVRTAAGLFDLSHMGELHLDGPGAGAALDYALVGNLTALAVGRARYTMIVAEDGGIIDDLIVYRLADESYLVVANAANAAVVAEALTERIDGFDAVLTDRSRETALIAVQGPAAAEIVVGLTDPAQADAVRELKYYASVPATVGGVDALVARTGYTGEDGFELFVPADRAPGLWRTILAAGQSHGLVPAGLAARDSLRLEAGMPLYGNELDRTTAPHDAGLGRVVKLDKVDADGTPLPFVGRAALASRAHANPSRVLVGLVGSGRRAARHGYPVVMSTADDAVTIGQVTSGAPSPTLGVPVAMAYVSPEVSAPGTELAVDIRGRREPVRVVALPFYRRSQS
ncbi:glycine cleavage system aminomethyltransferase GcvT [Cellulomonas denverensis]|uniref:Aminomethyltransferase n=1 Tax=Cellulomonas denverensis TaxID=264297 RepID=A0A7X6R0D7_9CELL|nr:glycine cleavage system aminomethyltransferase GcvT [Cellulomonas denverensis]NKY24204.1 glycine cleavage system aminomethyltransferase GcvT [Cellulomonas denverensis]GIG24881.1 aminomethyltransferase [Cellulomonas denverensis]